VIPSNDDAIRAIKLLVGKIADAVLEGKALRKDVEEEIPEAGVALPAEEERELSDEELLGAATLAKIMYHGKEDEEEKLEVELIGEDIEEDIELEWDEEEITKGKAGGGKNKDIEDEEEN